jgi:hypothetical protein
MRWEQIEMSSGGDECLKFTADVWPPRFSLTTAVDA